MDDLNDQIRDARFWIGKVLGEDMDETQELHEVLKDGVILCRVGNKLIPNSCKIQKSKFPFKQMENVEAFINLARQVGVPDSENFQTIDLFENKNFKQVLICIYSLSRNAKKRGYDVELIGPALRDKTERHFTEEQLRAGLYIPSKTMGNNLGANASGIRYGQPRQVIPQDHVLKPATSSKSSLNRSNGSMSGSEHSAYTSAMSDTSAGVTGSNQSIQATANWR